MTQTGYGPAQRCIFDGDEDKYEQWECKMLAYMKLRKLKHVILPGAPASAEKFSVHTTQEQENKGSFPSTRS